MLIDFEPVDTRKIKTLSVHRLLQEIVRIQCEVCRTFSDRKDAEVLKTNTANIVREIIEDSLTKHRHEIKNRLYVIYYKLVIMQRESYLGSFVLNRPEIFQRSI